MKKSILFLFFLTLLLAWKYYKKDQPEDYQENDSDARKSQRPSTKLSPQAHQPIKKILNAAKPPPTKKIKNSTRTINKKPLANSRSFNERAFNDRKMVISDENGNLYPTNLTVADDFIIAFGDLIVAKALDAEDIRNGKKVLSVPIPKLWPKGVVPIEVSSEVEESQQFEWIKEIMKELEESNQIKIRLADPLKDNARVLIKRGKENCYAQVGFTGEVTSMSLSPACSKAAIYHEFFHILGFYHEQNRFDRDEYLEILWENIDETFWPQFKLFPENSFPRPYTSGGPFNFTFDTIMIYDSKFFSTNNDYSMVRVDGTPFSNTFQRPTQTDIDRLKHLYREEVE